MKTLKILLTSFAFITISNSAIAGYYDQDNTYAQVVDVQPIYEEYRVPQNNRVCNNNSRGRSHNNSQYNSNGGGSILGGIIGGIIGNRFGKGHGRRAATAAGVAIGASIGANSNSNRNRNNNYNRNSNRRNACYNQKDYRVEQRITGYDVSYDYKGQIYQARMQNHPGDRVRVQVNVQVAEY